MNYSPKGIDQVNAAEACFNFIIENQQELQTHEKSKEIVMKTKQKYFILKTQHLLHQYFGGGDVVEERLLILAQNPQELIQTLYLHESILQDQKININRLNEEIALLHNLDFDRIQKKLLEKWLGLNSRSRNSGVSGESTVFEETVSVGTEDEMSDESIIRAFFILKSWDTTKAMTYLMFYILDRQGVNTGKELQLVECYTILSNNNGEVDEDDELISQEYYNILKCVHNLTQLGYKINNEKFKSIEKLVLIKDIWKKHANDTRGLELIVYICLGFEIYESQVWNGVLKQMVAKDMITQLQSLVLILSARRELLHVTGLASAWMAVIKSPFRTKSDVKDQILTKSLILLQSCPVTANLNYTELTEVCLRLGRPHIAAVFISYAHENQRETLIEMIRPHVKEQTKAEIQELKEYGVHPSIIQTAISTLFLKRT